MPFLRRFLVLGVFSMTAMHSQTPTPPVAPHNEHREVRHGATVIDPYFWLREKSNPEVVKYLEAENAYTEAMTARPEALQRRALQGDAGAYQADRPLRARPPRRLLLLLAHRGGQAVPHPVPPQRHDGSARGSAARPQRTRQGPEVCRTRRLRGQRRPESARLHHRLHRLPPVRPARQRSAQRADAAPTPPSASRPWPGPPTTRRSS